MRDRLETLIKSGLKDMPVLMKTHVRAQTHVSLTSKINENPHSEQKKNNQTGMAKNELLTYTKG